MAKGGGRISAFFLAPAGFLSWFDTLQNPKLGSTRSYVLFNRRTEFTFNVVLMALMAPIGFPFSRSGFQMTLIPPVSTKNYFLRGCDNEKPGGSFRK
jgi:hypothetical protein